MRRTNLYLDEAQTAELDDLARRQGISRAELVRRFIDRCLNSSATDLDADLAAIESSFGVLGVLGGEELPVRAPDERARHLDQLRRA